MKLADAANTTAIANGRGFKPVFSAVATAKGNTNAAAALFPTVAAVTLVMRYTTASRPYPPACDVR